MSPRPAADPGDSRREFLRRILRTGAYVPPTVVAMSMRSLSVAAATCPGKNAACGGFGGKCGVVVPCPAG